MHPCKVSMQVNNSKQYQSKMLTILLHLLHYHQKTFEMRLKWKHCIIINISSTTQESFRQTPAGLCHHENCSCFSKGKIELSLNLKKLSGSNWLMLFRAKLGYVNQQFMEVYFISNLPLFNYGCNCTELSLPHRSHKC